MFTFTKRMYLIAGAIVSFFGGFSEPAWATYGGGACHRCAPPAVVESQCNVVALAPQVQTVYQTVYETVYDSEPMTVMETRYRMAYKTENYTVMRPVAETSYVERPYTVMKPVYQTVNQQRHYRVMKPVYQTERRERRYRVMKPVYQTVNHERRYTVYRPVVKTQQMERRYTVRKPVYQTVNQERRYTVMKPVYQTEQRERRYTVMKPVYQTVNQERRTTVMRPVYETAMVDQSYIVRRPVTTCRQEVVECGYYERQYTTEPGPVVERKVRVPAEDCGCEKRGLFSCLHHKKVTATVAVQCPPRVVSQRVFVSRPTVRTVSETRYVRETMIRKVPVQTCRMVAEERVETIPVTTCQYVAEQHVDPYEVRTCRMVAEEQVETIPVTTCQYVAEEHVEPYEVRTCQMVAEERVGDDPRHDLPVCRRGARRAVRGPDLSDGGGGAGGDDPRHHLPVRQRAAVRTGPGHDVPDGGRDRVAPGAGVCLRAGPRHRESVRRPPRPAADRRPAVHDGAGRCPDLPLLQLRWPSVRWVDRDDGRPQAAALATPGRRRRSLQDGRESGEREAPSEPPLPVSRSATPLSSSLQKSSSCQSFNSTSTRAESWSRVTVSPEVQILVNRRGLADRPTSAGERRESRQAARPCRCRTEVLLSATAIRRPP